MRASDRDMTGECCIVCGHYGVNVHHEPPKGLGGEKAWHGSLLSLCGSGTTGCHGLRHAKRLRLEWRDGRWMWKGESMTRRSADWIDCHGDAFWNSLRRIYG